MNNLWIWIVVLIIILGGGYWWYTSSQATLPVVNQGASSPVGGTATNEDEFAALVSYTNDGYTPATVNIKKGETVRFVNNSDRDTWPASARHPDHVVYDGTSRTEHCPNTDGTAFDACRGLTPGESWEFTFDKVGEWAYHDHLIAQYFGKVIVTE